ncbi:PREDICTED: uncharacterized protein LOC104768087 [Camelina sativa]|uniref:Uncharacterized protein LOC104768087 n=1 Tax=Camelina sativa TaxID=90675 RepID=A0ABM0XSE1_CAMSA|nr:PREDICTED: uncharacterized protein LOC104768087 [Camelina sativa]
MAEDLRLHYTNGTEDDGVNPFGMQNTNHSTWPVLLVNYNTPPTMCMKAEYIMLTLLIPGPTALGNNIDVYLAPLIDDLKDLWAEGIEVYDSFAKENFTLRAMLLWSINDYPALGTLSGCKVKGKQACNRSGERNRTYLQQPTGYPRKKRPFSAKRLSKFRGHDGYCGNIANSVSVNPPNIDSLKLHDHHVLVQNLLPAALRGLLHKGPRIAINRLCSYFNRLCQRIIDPEKLTTMETEFVETMCQLERFFPPSLFDIMFHLPIHLSKEARLGGPVHFRWMYPFERYMKTLKAFVKNHARPEACMAEGYLAGECVAFCLEFLKDSVPVQETVNRNEDIEADRSVVEGRPLQKGIEVTLSDKDRDIAHRYVLMNMASLDPYIEMHLEELQANDARCAKNESLLWKNHTEHLMIKVGILLWQIHSDSTNSHSKEIRWLAFGPRNVALAHKRFIVNGKRFNTDAVKRKTQNSGVTYEAFSMCRSSARDMRQVADMLTYYGVIKENLLMDYHMFKVPLFRCNWANTGNGVKEEDGFTLVNLHLNQTAYLKDPFILPSQAKQVFYSREDDNSNWYVVMRAPPRGYHELETEEDLGVAPLLVQEVDDLDDETCDDDSVYVRDDCEGLLVVD